MNINVIHIDDDPKILESTLNTLNGMDFGEHKLSIKNSCNFKDGMALLEENDYDLVILDLCVGEASQDSDKIGEEVFEQIKKRVFIPVVFFTGLPNYVEHLKSDIVGVASKVSAFDDVILEISRIISGGFLEIKTSMTEIVKEGLRSYFWDFVHPNSETIKSLLKDEVSLRYLLLRRLAKTISSEVVRAESDPGFKQEHSHPMEFYIYPIVEGEFENCDILRCNRTGNLYVILTPSCDFVLRKGTRKAERILLVQAIPFRSLADFPRYEELKKKKEELVKSDKDLDKLEIAELAKLIDKLKKHLNPGNNDRYFFLPKTPFIEATLVDFQNKVMVSYEELEKMFTPLATISDPIAQSLLAQFTRYYSRIGYHDLDKDYAFDRI